MEEEQCGATLNKKVTGKNIYVGNLSYDAKDGDLYQVFAPYGIVKSVRIVKDKFSGESRGFAFVEMATLIETQLAIEGLQGRDFKGRKLMVKEAHPRSEGRPQGRKRDLGKRGGGSRQGERHANRRSKERRI
ncbi:MAG: RNA-binding protein [Candidatus Omnitrophica bacterium]|nr:RNA-binding protein [Candidatus Omnitrophota bacterium]